MAVGRQGGTAGGRGGGAIGTTQAALAVVVVAAVALAALLLHPHGGLHARGRGPLGGSGLLTVALAAAALGAGLALHGRVSSRIPYERPLTALEQRLSDAAGLVLILAAVAVPLLTLALHRFGTSPRHDGDAGPHHPRSLPLPTPPPAPTALPHHRPAPAHHYGIMRVLAVVAVVLLVAALAAAGVHLVRRLRLPAAPQYAPADEPADDERERLARAVDSGRRALDGGQDPRAAVIACYVAMEESLAASGVARRASDSPQDLLERAAEGGLPARSAATRLTALFREARYSSHPMDAGHRERAAAALREMAERLAAHQAAAETAAGSPAAGREGRPGAGGPAAKEAR